MVPSKRGGRSPNRHVPRRESADEVGKVMVKFPGVGAASHSESMKWESFSFDEISFTYVYLLEDLPLTRLRAAQTHVLRRSDGSAPSHFLTTPASCRKVIWIFSCAVLAVSVTRRSSGSESLGPVAGDRIGSCEGTDTQAGEQNES